MELNTWFYFSIRNLNVKMPNTSAFLGALTTLASTVYLEQFL